MRRIVPAIISALLLVMLLLLFFAVCFFPLHAAERPPAYIVIDDANEFANRYGEWVTIINARVDRCQNTCVDVNEAAAFKRMDSAYKRFHTIFSPIYK